MKTNNYQNGDEFLLNGFVNSEKARQLLNCGKTKLYYLRKEKQLIYSKVNNKIFYLLSSIQELIEKNLVH
jgi:hypothetical protein